MAKNTDDLCSTVTRSGCHTSADVTASRGKEGEASSATDKFVLRPQIGQIMPSDDAGQEDKRLEKNSGCYSSSGMIEAMGDDEERGQISLSRQSSLTSKSYETTNETYSSDSYLSLSSSKEENVNNVGIKPFSISTSGNQLLGVTRACNGNKPEPSLQDDLENRSDFSASDDGESDSSGISRGSSRFVRSFNRRVRTRDPRGRNFQRINAIRIRSRPALEKQHEVNFTGKKPCEQNNNASTDETMISNENIEDIPRALQNISPSYSEASSGDRFDSDTYEMCSPGSDDVFWNYERNFKVPYDQPAGVASAYQERDNAFDLKPPDSIVEGVRFRENPDSFLPIKVGDDLSKTKESTGSLSFFNMLSKSVNIKRKYGKVPNKAAPEGFMADSENLEKIMENNQEGLCEQKHPGIRSHSLTPSLEVGLRETDNESLDSVDCCLNTAQLSQRSHSLTPTPGTSDNSEGDIPLNEVLKNDTSFLDVKSQFLKPVKPVPPPRSKKPVSSNIRNGLASCRERDSHSSNESLDTSSGVRNNREDAGGSHGYDYGRLRSVSNTFCNLWPQFFSGTVNNKSQEKDHNMNKKILPVPDPSSNVKSKQLQCSAESKRKVQGEDNSENFRKSKNVVHQSQELDNTGQRLESHDDNATTKKHKAPERRSLPQSPQCPPRRTLPPKPQIPTRSSSYAPQPPSADTKPKRPQVPVRSSSYRPNVTGSPNIAQPQSSESGFTSQRLQLPGYAPKGTSATKSSDCLNTTNTDFPKESIAQKKAKLFPSFSLSPEASSKKANLDKNNLKDKKQPQGTQSRMRRTGAVKRSDERRFRTLDEFPSPGVLRRMLSTDNLEDTKKLNMHKKQANIGMSLDGGSHTGAIPKSSYLNKTFHIMNRDVDGRKSCSDAKPNDKSESDISEHGSDRAVEKSVGKKVLDRSTSVPFWTKLYMTSGGNAPSSPSSAIRNMGQKKIVEENAPNLNQESKPKGSKDVKQKLTHTTSSPPNPIGSSSQFSRKVSHKRTRSYDSTKTFKEEFLSLPPERSASDDNLKKLMENQDSDMPVLAVEFASPDSPPQMEFKSLRFATGSDSCSYKSSQKHKSCNDIIEINGDVLEPMSPKFARTFKDSRLKSASALCLTNSHAKKINAALRRDGGGGEDSCPSGESTPSWPPGFASGERKGLKSCQQVYISPYELTTHARDKPYFQRLIGMFHVQISDSKMDSLVQQLDLYSRQGIPKQPHLLTFQTYQIDQEVVVEESWRTLVEGHEQLDDRQEQQQSAIWELVETEATYIHMLKVITDLFLSCLCNLQNESLLSEIDTDKLFSNIQEIYNANLTFWREHICRMLEVARSTRQPLDPTLLSDGFYKFDELFHPYTRYCLDQSHCQLYCKEKDHDNEYFKMYLAWCETQKECNRLRLVDILVQPMQRLTKYSLLLKAILKKTNSEDHKLALQDMITHVENFVSNVNSALRHKHEQERLRDIAKRIEAYEAVEARDDELEKVVKTYSDLSLTQPMPGCPEHLPRHILHHGDLRLRDPHSSKMDVHVFLFTDLLLITKVTQRKAERVKIIRPPYHVERLILVDLKDTTSIGLVSINEWNVAVAAFTLQCPDQRTHKTWYDALKRAKEQYKEAQQARDVMIYEDMPGIGHLAPRSPRPGSSRASRVSSLAHSHSGSIDLNEHSPASTHHPPSFDMSEIRASSASSDDSIAPTEAEIQRSKSLEGGGYNATSPRPDRRPAFPKTPNTLSVVPPYSTGQSLPNLTVESANSLRVPNNLSNNPKALSACNRGVSYPPPSPRTLRRSAPVPQSRNPPLIKTRHVTSMVGSPQEIEQADQDESSRGPRRISRTDRMDNRRYHTAGAIDDIKKQDSKDTTIHKRLSWNYGQGPPPSRDLGSDQGKLGRHKHAVKSISCESMHSSSGVSSTSSLHRSMGSELETLENIDDNELEAADGESTVVDLTVSDCTSLKISPHISTTYICHDSDITLGVCSQYITQPDSATEPSEGCENLVKIDVSETDPGISSVQITVTEGAASSSSLNLSSTTTEGAPSKPDNMRMREILLNDASVEASDV